MFQIRSNPDREKYQVQKMHALRILIFFSSFNVMYSTTTKLSQHVPKRNIKNMLFTLFALTTGGRIQTLPSGQVRIIFKWQYFFVSLLAACLGTFVIVNTTHFSWNNIDQNDEETTFAPFTCRKGSSKWRNYITNQPINHLNTHPKRMSLILLFDYKLTILKQFTTRETVPIFNSI